MTTIYCGIESISSFFDVGYVPVIWIAHDYFGYDNESWNWCGCRYVIVMSKVWNLILEPSLIHFFSQSPYFLIAIKDKNNPHESTCQEWAGIRKEVYARSWRKATRHGSRRTTHGAKRQVMRALSRIELQSGLTGKVTFVYPV